MANRSLGSLTLDLIAKIGGFKAGMDQAARVAENASKRMRKTFEGFGLGVAAGFAAVTTGLTAMLVKSLHAAEANYDLAQSIGTTVESLTALQYVAKLSGVESEELSKGLIKLSSAIVDTAVKGTGPAAATFEALGISVKDAHGNIKDLLPVVLEVADAFSKAPDGVVKTAAAGDLFGTKLGAKLIPLLNEGREKIEGMIKEAERMGLILTGPTAKAADEFGDNMERMKGFATGFGNLLAADLAPTLANFSADLLHGAGSLDILKDAAHVAGNFLRALLTVFEIVRYTASEFAKTLKGLFQAISEASHGEFAKAWDTLGDLSKEGADNLEKEVTKILDIWDDTAQQTYTNAPKWGEQLAAPAKEGKKQTQKELEEMQRFLDQEMTKRNDAMRAFETIAPALGSPELGILGENELAIGEAMAKIRDEDLPDLQTKFIEVSDTISEEGLQAARNFESAFAEFLFDPFQDGLDGMLRGFIDILRQMVAEIAASQIIDALGGTSGIGGFLSGLFGAGASGVGTAAGTGLWDVVPLAGGGSVSAGTHAIVGEHGPERVLFGDSATVIPNDELGGGVVINNYMDNRGASQDLIRVLPKILDERDRRIITSIRDAKSRGVK